jgi:glycerol-3-phosphate cytidylyltransferase
MTLGPLIGYVPGVFDLFHVGHLNVLRQARELCDVLVAGVVSDEVCASVKGLAPFVPLEERIAIVDAVGIVDATYAELTTDKVDAWHEVGFQRLFKGDDWKGTERGMALEERMSPYGVEVVYFPYTVHTSSSHLRALIAAARPA